MRNGHDQLEGNRGLCLQKFPIDLHTGRTSPWASIPSSTHVKGDRPHLNPTAWANTRKSHPTPFEAVARRRFHIIPSASYTLLTFDLSGSALIGHLCVFSGRRPSQLLDRPPRIHRPRLCADRRPSTPLPHTWRMSPVIGGVNPLVLVCGGWGKTMI
jgi:hypothetical protein